MPINMKHARRIAGTATQTEDTRNVRGETASRASGLKVAQSQNAIIIKGRRGYNKGQGMVQG